MKKQIEIKKLENKIESLEETMVIMRDTCSDTFNTSEGEREELTQDLKDAKEDLDEMKIELKKLYTTKTKNQPKESKMKKTAKKAIKTMTKTEEKAAAKRAVAKKVEAKKVAPKKAVAKKEVKKVNKISGIYGDFSRANLYNELKKRSIKMPGGNVTKQLVATLLEDYDKDPAAFKAANAPKPKAVKKVVAKVAKKVEAKKVAKKSTKKVAAKKTATKKSSKK